MDYIQIGGEERPFHFSNKVAYSYETENGRSYLADAYQCARNLTSAAQTAATGGDGPINAAFEIKVSLVTDLAYAGFQYAHRKAGVLLDFTKEDLAAWIIEDPQCAVKIMEAIILAIAPKGEQEEPTKKKKVKPKPKPKPIGIP